jgi:hypothetical protein
MHADTANAAINVVKLDVGSDEFKQQGACLLRAVGA